MTANIRDDGLLSFSGFICSMDEHAQSSNTFLDANLLKKITEYFNYQNMSISIYDHNQCVGGCAINKSRYLIDAFLGGFCSRDMLSKYVSTNIIDLTSGNTCSVVRGSTVLSQNQSAAEEYGRFLDNAGMQYTAVLPINSAYRIAIHKNACEGDFNDREVNLLRSILNVISSKYKSFIHMKTATDLAQMHSDLLSGLSIGCITLDKSLQVKDCNAYMHYLLKEIFNTENMLSAVFKLNALTAKRTELIYNGFHFTVSQIPEINSLGMLDEYSYITVQKSGKDPASSAWLNAALSNALPIEELTPRELEILDSFSKGHSWSDIGKKLYISEGTVKTHIKNIYRKLNVANQRELIYRYSALITARTSTAPKRY